MRRISDTYESQDVVSFVSYSRILETMTRRNEPERDKIIQKALSRLRGFSKEINLKWLSERFNAKNSPLVRGGTRTLNEAFYEFVNAWGVTDQELLLSDDQISQFFYDLSAGIDRRDVFEAHVMHPLHLL